MRIDVQAERGYRQGLVVYPKNPPLLRSYSQFMQDVKLNPNASMRYWMEADKLEAQQLQVCGCVCSWFCTWPFHVYEQLTFPCIFELTEEHQ